MKKQKRFISDTMLNLHKKLMLEMLHLKLSYSLFCRLKPFWILSQNINNRETCVCKVHDNAEMKANRLKQLGIIKLQSLSKVADLCCATEARACMYRECISCRNKSLPHTGTSTGTTRWYQWLPKKDYGKGVDGQNAFLSFLMLVKHIVCLERLLFKLQNFISVIARHCLYLKMSCSNVLQRWKHFSVKWLSHTKHYFFYNYTLWFVIPIKILYGRWSPCYIFNDELICFIGYNMFKVKM